MKRSPGQLIRRFGNVVVFVGMELEAGVCNSPSVMVSRDIRAMYSNTRGIL
jgi:hypothetical protein